MYSLDPTHKYNISRRTPNMKISYYVKDGFSSDFTGNMKKLEREVEDAWVEVWNQRNRRRLNEN